MARSITPPAVIRHHNHNLGPLAHEACKPIAIESLIADGWADLNATLLKNGCLVATAQLSRNAAQVNQLAQALKPPRHSLHTNNKAHLVVNILRAIAIYGNGRVVNIAVAAHNLASRIGYLIS